MLLVRSFASFAAHIEQHAAHLFIFLCNPAASFWITLGSAHSFTGLDAAEVPVVIMIYVMIQ